MPLIRSNVPRAVCCQEVLGHLLVLLIILLLPQLKLAAQITDPLLSPTSLNSSGSSAFLGAWELANLEALPTLTSNGLAAIGGVDLKNTYWSCNGLTYHLSKDGTYDSVSMNADPNATIVQPKDREERLVNGKLVKLPQKLIDLGLGWGSSWLQWKTALSGQQDFSLSITKSPTIKFSQVYGQGLPVRIVTSPTAAMSIRWNKDNRYSMLLTFEYLGKSFDPDAEFTLSNIMIFFKSNATGTGPTPVTKTEKIQFDDNRRFALGLSGILIQQNRDWHESLENKSIGVGGEEALLERDWGIHNREELLAMCQKLQVGLHSKTWNDLVVLLAANPDKSPRQIITDQHLSNNAAARLFFVAEVGGRLGPDGIAAWDLGRCVALARWGYQCRYLNADEAWAIILPIWERVKSRYQSWDDWAFHYIVGRAFWGLPSSQYLNYANQALAAWADMELLTNSIYRQTWSWYEDLPRKAYAPNQMTMPESADAMLMLRMISTLTLSGTNTDITYRLMKKLCGEAPDFPIIRRNFCAVLRDQKKLDEALIEADNLVKLWPADQANFVELARVHELREDTASAETAWQSALSLSPEWFDALVGLGNLEARQGRHQQALDQFKKAAATLPADTVVSDQPDFWMAYCWELIITNQPRMALQWLDPLVVAYPEWGFAQYAWGLSNLYLDQAHWDKAYQGLSAARRLKITLPDEIEEWMRNWENQSFLKGE